MTIMRIISLLLLVLVLFATCQKEEIRERDFPRISTGSVTNITSQGATFSGEILGNPDGVTEYGFVWGISENLTTDESEKIVIDENLTGNLFTYEITYALTAMKNYCVRAYVKSGDYIVYGNPVTFKSLGSEAPVIESFEPKSGVWRDTVIIYGKNFSYQNVNNLVYFGNYASRPISSTDKSIKALVPDALSLIDSKVSVETYGNRCTSEESFHLITPGRITSVDKRNVFWGDTLTFSGEFPVTGTVGIVLGSMEAPVISRSTSEIKALVPLELPLTDSVSVSLNINNHMMSAPFKEHLIKPYISSIVPALFGWNDTIRINGYFHPTSGYTKFTISGIQPSILSYSKSAITCVVPSTNSHNCPFNAAIKQTVFYQDTFSLNGPVITKIIPATALPYQQIEIIGKYFKEGATKININDQGSYYLDQVTPTSCIAYLSNNIRNGPAKIQLTVYNKSTVNNTLLTITSPQISDFFPKEAFYGDIITITGANFSPDLQVYIGGHLAEVNSVTSKQIIAKIPETSSQSNEVSVYCSTFTLTFQEHLRIISPIIDSISKELFQASDTVIIYGKYFNSTDWENIVSLGGNVCNIIDATSTQIKFLIPELTNGQYKLTLSSGGRYLEYGRYVTFSSPWQLYGQLMYSVEYARAELFNSDLFVIAGSQSLGYYQKFSMLTKNTLLYNSSPFSQVSSGAIFNLNGNCYFGLGHHDIYSFDNTFYRLDILTDTWTRLQDLPVNQHRAYFYFALNSTCYVGLRVSDPYGWELWGFNLHTEVWNKITTCPMVNDNTKAFVVGGKAYVIDGVKLWVYDPSNNEWNQLNDFPGSLRYHATGFVLNQKIYYGTGSILDVYPSTTTTGLSDLWCYNPSDNTWKRLTDLPRGLYAGFGFSYGGKGYIGGGITYMMQRNIYEYDPALDQ